MKGNNSCMFHLIYVCNATIHSEEYFTKVSVGTGYTNLDDCLQNLQYESISRVYFSQGKHCSFTSFLRSIANDGLSLL